MRRIAVYFVIVIMGVFLLSACGGVEEQALSTPYIDAPTAPTNTDDITASPTPDVEETPDVKELGIVLESYDVSVDILSSDGIIELKAFNVPTTINGCEPMFAGIIDKENIVLCLNREYVTREIGIYNIWSEDYQPVYTFDENNEGSIHGVVYADSEIMVLLYSYDMTSRSIGVLYIADGRLVPIFERSSIDPETGYPYRNWNDISRVGDYVYFDDIFLGEDNVVCVDLFRYNIYAHTMERVKEDAQNPMPYRDTVLVFTPDDNMRYRVLTVLPDEKLLDVGVSLTEVASEGSNVFCIENINTNHEKRYTVWGLTNLITNEIILSTKEPQYITIADIDVNGRFASFFNYHPEYPCIYDITLDSLLVIDKLPKALSQFYLAAAAEYGILWCATEQGGELEHAYYFFEAC